MRHLYVQSFVFYTSSGRPIPPDLHQSGGQKMKAHSKPVLWGPQQTLRGDSGWSNTDCRASQPMLPMFRLQGTKAPTPCSSPARSMEHSPHNLTIIHSSPPASEVPRQKATLTWDKVLRILPMHFVVHVPGPTVHPVGWGWPLKPHTHCSTAIWTIRIWTRTHIDTWDGCNYPTCQPRRVYQPEDLSFGPLDSGHASTSHAPASAVNFITCGAANNEGPCGCHPIISYTARGEWCQAKHYLLKCWIGNMQKCSPYNFAQLTS